MIAIMIMAVLIVYLSFVIAVSKSVYKKPEKVFTKWLASIGTAVFLLFAPVADSIVGEVYLKYLCATQGGIHVYETVELGAEYFKDDGVPVFYDRNKGLHEMSMGGRYFGSSEAETISKALNVEMIIDRIVDAENNSTLGSIIYFAHFGGWLINSTGLHVNGSMCPSDYIKVNYVKNLSELVFVKQEIN